MTWNIFSKCDTCVENLKVTSLSDHNQRVIIKLQQVFKQQYAICGESQLITVPEKLCEVFVLRIPFGNSTFGIFSKQNVNGNMQTDPHDPKESENKEETGQDQPRHQYNCDCHECQIKFGSLPLLVQVIEGQEKSSLENISTNSAMHQSSDINEPSTSSSSSNSKKTIPCPHCSKTFTHRGDLNKHVRKHTGEQPYVCTVCKRRFAHTSNLNRHLRVHSGDRPFVCDICNKNFSRKDKLDLHKKTKLCRKFGEKNS